MNFCDARIDTLVRACAESGNEDAWTEFINRFGKSIEAMVAKACAQLGTFDPPAIDDAIQETYLKLCDRRCRVMKDFDERQPDSIYGLLKAVALSVVQDRFRTANARKRGSGIKAIPLNEIVVASDAPDPDLRILIAEIERELQTATLRDRTIFWLYFRHGLTTRAIAAFPCFGLSQKGVEAVIERLTKYLRGRFVAAATRNSEGKASRSAF